MHLKLIGVIMLRIKWIFFCISFLGLSISVNCIEANQAGVSKELFRQDVPIQENTRAGDFPLITAAVRKENRPFWNSWTFRCGKANSFRRPHLGFILWETHHWSCTNDSTRRSRSDQLTPSLCHQSLLPKPVLMKMVQHPEKIKNISHYKRPCYWYFGIAYSFTAIPQLRKFIAKKTFLIFHQFWLLQVNGNIVVSSAMISISALSLLA